MLSARFQPTPARLATPSFTGVQPRKDGPGPERSNAPRTAENLPAQGIGEMLALVGDVLQPQKRIVRAGDVLYRAGERFDCLHVLNSGMFKVVKLTSDGREQVVGIKFRGDWLGLDGIARG